jgi:hypothetical protein
MAWFGVPDDNFVPITQKLAWIGDNVALPRVAPVELGTAGGRVAPGQLTLRVATDDHDQSSYQDDEERE